MSRHRFCPTSDRDGFIEELAQELWKQQQNVEDGRAWAEANADMRQRFLSIWQPTPCASSSMVTVSRVPAPDQTGWLR